MKDFAKVMHSKSGFCCADRAVASSVCAFQIMVVLGTAIAAVSIFLALLGLLLISMGA